MKTPNQNDPQILKNLSHINEATLKLEKLKHPARRIDIMVILEELLTDVQKSKELTPDKNRKRYSVSAKICDNITGKDAHIYMDSDEPEKLGHSIGKFVEASCGLMNLEKEELKLVQQAIQEKLTNKEKPIGNRIKLILNKIWNKL
jgi:hypothetical protein